VAKISKKLNFSIFLKKSNFLLYSFRTVSGVFHDIKKGKIAEKVRKLVNFGQFWPTITLGDTVMDHYIIFTMKRAATAAVKVQQAIFVRLLLGSGSFFLPIHTLKLWKIWEKSIPGHVFLNVNNSLKIKAHKYRSYCSIHFIAVLTSSCNCGKGMFCEKPQYRKIPVLTSLIPVL
jgi:hypothetical protein